MLWAVLDVTSNMSGPKGSVAKQLRGEELRALYLHYHGTALNLHIKKCKFTKDARDVAFEGPRLIRFSPKRTVDLEKLKNELALGYPGFRVLCLPVGQFVLLP